MAYAYVARVRLGLREPRTDERLLTTDDRWRFRIILNIYYYMFFWTSDAQLDHLIGRMTPVLVVATHVDLDTLYRLCGVVPRRFVPKRPFASQARSGVGRPGRVVDAVPPLNNNADRNTQTSH
jgi:hypothetical protein